VIVNVFVETAVASTISSRAVSGSMTRVKVRPAGIVTPPRSAVPETTVIDVAPDVMEPVSVDCWERDEYWRVVIQVPIGCSELVGGIVLADEKSLRRAFEYRERKVVW
jgi:hypothetical protein